MKLIRINPELQRNIWETITPTKLVIMPIVLGLIFMLVDSAVQLATVSLVLFYIITVMVGSYMAGEEIPGEIQDKTWDWQRMSAMTPMQMTLGKLWGSTIYQWYAGVICIIVFIVASIALKMDVLRLIQFVFCMILTATFFQSITMIFGIGTRDMPIGLRRFLIIAVLLSLGIILVTIFIVFSFASYLDKKIDTEIIEHSFNWFFLKLPIITHFLMALFFLNAWSFIGLYRAFRTEMYYFNGPELYIVFLISIPFYFSGYLTNIPNLSISIYLTLLFAGIALFAYNSTLITALIDKMEIVGFRRLFYHLKIKDYKKAGYNTPMWLVSFITEIFFSVFALGMYFIASSELNKFEEGFSTRIFFFLLVINLFLVRDLGIFLYNNFTQGRNATGITLAYLFVLYQILPALMVTSGNEQLLPAFYPIPYDKNFEFSWINILIPLIQAVIMVLLVKKVWEEKNAKLQASIQN